MNTRSAYEPGTEVLRYGALNTVTQSKYATVDFYLGPRAVCRFGKVVSLYLGKQPDISAVSHSTSLCLAFSASIQQRKALKT